MDLISLVVLSLLWIAEYNHFGVLYLGLARKRVFSCYFCIYIAEGFGQFICPVWSVSTPKHCSYELLLFVATFPFSLAPFSPNT